MSVQKYSVNQHLIETLLSWVKSGEIAIPEIQRPFVWDASKVRDLMDSLYQGFPVGYVIAWRNPNVRLKDGSFSEGKKILIDGQQRVTALKAAILGEYVINKQYQRVKIKIAFHPLEERFEVQNTAIIRDKAWLPDISEYYTTGTNSFHIINETNFKRFVMIIKSAGFVVPGMIRSKNALNFAYLLYLKLRDRGETPANIESYVKRWFVMSILTQRATGSFESQFDFDIKQIAERPIDAYLQEIEESNLSDGFWNTGLPQHLNTSSMSSPFYYVFLAAQVTSGDKGFLSRDINVRELVEHRGDVHHIFPKDLLKKQGLQRWHYNQIANYAYMQSEINIQIGNKPPAEYFAAVRAQCANGLLHYGSINDLSTLRENLATHCIPESIYDMLIADYEDFLEQRRKLMAQKIKDYYQSL